MTREQMLLIRQAVHDSIGQDYRRIAQFHGNDFMVKALHRRITDKLNAIDALEQEVMA